MNSQQQNIIRKHIQDAEKPLNAKKYYTAIEAALRNLLKMRAPKVLRKYGKKFVYLPLQEIMPLDADPYRKGYGFNLVGILKCFDMLSDEYIDEVYCCVEAIFDTLILFFVDCNEGRIKSIVRCQYYESVISEIMLA